MELRVDAHGSQIKSRRSVFATTFSAAVVDDDAMINPLFPFLQAILLGRGTVVHSNAGWNKVSNTVADIIQTAPILGGSSFKAKNRSYRTLPARDQP